MRARARASLKQLVHSLRRRLAPPDLLAPGADLRLNAERVSSDVSDFRLAISGHDYEGAVRTYAGPFLEGFHVRRADGFERWASGERLSLARDHARALEHLAADAEQRGDAAAALVWWRRLCDAEPLGRRAVLGLIRALAGSTWSGEKSRHVEELFEVEITRRYCRNGEVPVGSRIIVPAGALDSIAKPNPPFGHVIGR